MMRRRSLFLLRPGPCGISAAPNCSGSSPGSPLPLQGYWCHEGGLCNSWGVQPTPGNVGGARNVWHRGLSSLPKPASEHPLPGTPSLKAAPALPHHTPTRCMFSKTSHRSPWLHSSLQQGLEEQIERYSHADRNTLPGLESADGVDLRDVHDGSQGFQGSTASLPDLPRQKDHSEVGHGHTSATVPSLHSPSPSQAEGSSSQSPAQCQEQLRMYLVSGTAARSPAPPARPPASHCQRARLDRTQGRNSPLWGC